MSGDRKACRELDAADLAAVWPCAALGGGIAIPLAEPPRQPGRSGQGLSR